MSEVVHNYGHCFKRMDTVHIVLSVPFQVSEFTIHCYKINFERYSEVQRYYGKKITSMSKLSTKVYLKPCQTSNDNVFFFAKQVHHRCLKKLNQFPLQKAVVFSEIGNKIYIFWF